MRMQTHGNGRFTPYRMAKGQLVLVLQDTMQSTEYTELVMTVVNGLEFRNYSRPVLRVKGCAEVPASLFTLVSFVPCCARVFVRVSVCIGVSLVPSGIASYCIQDALARLILPCINPCGMDGRRSKLQSCLTHMPSPKQGASRRILETPTVMA